MVVHVLSDISESAFSVKIIMKDGEMVSRNNKRDSRRIYLVE